MHPVYRQLLFAFLALISIIISCNRCNQRETFKKSQQEWGPDLDKQMRDVFYNQSIQLTTDENERNEYADCCLSHMKELFPNGLANMRAILNDSVKVAVMKMGVECVKNFKNHTNIWQPEVIEQLKLQMYSYPETKLIPDAAIKKEYVDCMAFKVTTRFPYGAGDKNAKDSLKASILKARKECIKLLTNKYQKLRRKQLIDDTSKLAR